MPCARRLGVALAVAAGLAAPTPAPGAHATYRNPLPVVTPQGERLETFADPSIVQAPDGSYYTYATSDALTDHDQDASGALRLRRAACRKSKTPATGRSK